MKFKQVFIPWDIYLMTHNASCVSVDILIRINRQERIHKT